MLQDDFDGSNGSKFNSAAVNKRHTHAFNLTAIEDHSRDLFDTDSDGENNVSLGTKKSLKPNPELIVSDALSHINGIRRGVANAGPSGRQTVTRIRTPVIQDQELTSESDSDISNHEKKNNIPGEYDPEQFQDLDVNNDIKDLFQYIIKYIPQNLNLDFKFRPFIPDHIPAVGDIDAFLKVQQPELNIDTDLTKCTIDQSYLGLTVLDEPSATQSDPALLHLRLRASSVNVSHTTDVVVKKVDNVEKNSKVIDKWIKDITDLHKSKTSPIVKYTDPMPDVDDLMQAWPENMENSLKVHGFPNYQSCPKLNQYIDIVCCLFDIPIYKNKIQSLHLLFSLYGAIKNSQLYRTATNAVETQEDRGERKQSTDQLVLE